MKEESLKRKENVNIKDIFKIENEMIDLIKEAIDSNEKEPRDLDISKERRFLDEMLGKPKKGMESIRDIEAMALKAITNR